MRQRTAWDRRDGLVVLLLVLSVSVFHGQGLRPGRTFLPVDLANAHLPWRAGPTPALQNWLISDPLYQFYPFLVHKISAIQQNHTWPLWDADVFTGHPALADPLYQTFYPFYTGLGLLLGAARGLAIGLWLHAVLAAVLTYGLLRALDCSRPAAALGALTYALSGAMVTWFETLFFTSTLAWLPGILWAFEIALQRASRRHVALAGLALGLATLGGQFQFVVTFMIFMALYAIGRAVELVRAERIPPCGSWAPSWASRPSGRCSARSRRRPLASSSASAGAR